MNLVILNGATSAQLKHRKARMHASHKTLTSLYTNKRTLELRRKSALSESVTRKYSCTFVFISLAE